MISELREALSRHLLPRRHTALLVAIVLAFAVRPLIGDVGAAPIVFSLALLLLMLTSLYAVQVDERVAGAGLPDGAARGSGVSRMGWILAAVALVERVVVFAAPSRLVIFAGTLGWFLFFSYVTWAELRSVLNQRDVTRETISMSISVYLLFGMAWGLLFAMMFQLDPGAFDLGPSATPESLGAKAFVHRFPIFVYFSLTTLATVGYGDIVPLTLQARYAAVAEGITGQLYLTILVARLGGLHMNRLTKEAPRDEPPARRG